MHIVKRLYSSDKKTALLSSVFNQVIREIDIPLPFDYLEFNIGYNRIEINDNKACFGLSVDDPMLVDYDTRIAKILIKFELYRLFVRNVITRAVPSVIEDVIVAREMLAHDHADDLAYLFYAYMARHRIHDQASFLKFNLPWIVFSNYDDFYFDLFFQLARNKQRYRYEHRAKELINALCKDLMDFENLKAAISAYERYVYE